MNILKEPFSISLNFNGANVPIKIYHDSETFDFIWQGQDVSILNNGDNSWSSIENKLDQEVVNLIGSEIEKHFQNLPL